jgi:predicted transcriptional regulator
MTRSLFVGKKVKQIPTEVTTEREIEIWSLRQRCWTQSRIAKQLGISQPAVNQVLKKLTHRYSKELLEDVIKVKTEQVQQLEVIAEEAMQAWERSKKKGKTVSTKRPLQADGSPLSSLGEQTEIISKQTGDPRYLTAAMKAKEDIRKIIGADAPIKTVNFNKDLASCSDAELLAIVNGEVPSN